VASLAAIAALLVAGSQLSSIGSLQGGSLRLWSAIAGATIGLGAVVAAIWKTVGILTPHKWTIEAVVEAVTASKKTTPQKRVAAFFNANPSYLASAESVTAVKQLYENAPAGSEEEDEWLEVVNKIREIASYEDVSSRFDGLKIWIAAAAILAAVGIGVFAWAANPPRPDDRPPSLRNADLQGADLSGGQLRNADLAGANLRNANLRGADLHGANIDGVTWGNTICPDGSNSDDQIRHGQTAQASCAGHLSP
jgi:hypothetical protein